MSERNFDRVASGLHIAFALAPDVTTELAELTTAAVRLAEEAAWPLRGIEPKAVEAHAWIYAPAGATATPRTLSAARCAASRAAA